MDTSIKVYTPKTLQNDFLIKFTVLRLLRLLFLTQRNVIPLVILLKIMCPALSYVTMAIIWLLLPCTIKWFGTAIIYTMIISTLSMLSSSPESMLITCTMLIITVSSLYCYTFLQLRFPAFLMDQKLYMHTTFEPFKSIIQKTTGINTISFYNKAD